MPQTTPTPPQPQQFVCNGDCKKCCSTQQWSFCASVHAYSNMKVLDKVIEILGKMQEEVSTIQASMAHISEKIETIQSNEAAVFDPTTEPPSPTLSSIDPASSGEHQAKK